MQTITIPRKWLEKLIYISDTIGGKTIMYEPNKETSKVFGQLNGLLGYIESAKYLLEEDERKK